MCLQHCGSSFQRLLCPTSKCGLGNVITAYIKILYEISQFLLFSSVTILHEKNPVAYSRGTGMSFRERRLRSMVQPTSKAHLRVSRLLSSFEIRVHGVIQLTSFSFLIGQTKDWWPRLLPCQTRQGVSSPSEGSQHCNAFGADMFIKNCEETNLNEHSRFHAL